MAKPRKAPWLWLPPVSPWVNFLSACIAAAEPRLLEFRLLLSWE